MRTQLISLEEIPFKLLEINHLIQFTENYNYLINSPYSSKNTQMVIKNSAQNIENFIIDFLERGSHNSLF
jgi:hypothetical protein